ncbi:MAG: 23S rRNA pseudouridine(1911/1915/1917) synthase RluD [Pseudomonadota bacterium]
MTFSQSITLTTEMYGKRIDQVLVELFPDYSRSRIQAWLKAGDITLNNKLVKPKHKVLGGETIQLHITEQPEGEWQAEDIPLDIQYEDEQLIIINKPAGLVVHPAVGNFRGTMLNGLLYHHPELINIPRAGIVHRLDKDTTGLLVVAKTLAAQTNLVEQLQQRSFEREYEALVVGELSGGGTIDTMYGRHPTQRTKMAVPRRPNSLSKHAITHFRIINRYAIHSRLKVNLETGRTHQIRVHMAYKQLPLVGDRVYGGRIKYPPNCSELLTQCLEKFKRQALHARKLGLEHPSSHEWMSWEQEVPADMQQLYDLLDENNK